MSTRRTSPRPVAVHASPLRLRDCLTARQTDGTVNTYQTDGTVNTYQGTYTVHLGVITGFDVVQLS